MYQENKKFNLSHLGNSELEFEKLINIFKTSINVFSLNKDSKQFDLSKQYKINHACLWNKPDNVGKNVIIVQKNNELALCVFKDDLELTQDKFYRLEDLDPI